MKILKKRRSAIVPAAVFALSLAVGASVIPQLAGCHEDTPFLTVAQVGFDVASQFDFSHPEDIHISGVADIAFHD